MRRALAPLLAASALVLSGCAAGDSPDGCDVDIDVHHPKTTVTKTVQPKPAPALTKRK